MLRPSSHVPGTVRSQVLTKRSAHNISSREKLPQPPAPADPLKVAEAGGSEDLPSAQG